MARKKPEPLPEDNAIEPAAVQSLQAAVASGQPAPGNDQDGVPAAQEQPKEGANARAVPKAVRERFLQVGEKFFFPSGDPAFRDLGRKLTTRSENAEVVRSLIEIAQS